MTDIIDTGCEREEKDRALALSVTLAWVDPTPPRGACYNCDEPVTGAARFCDTDCQKDWQRRNPGR